MKKFEFPVPKELRQSSKNHICGISIEGDDFVIEYLDSNDKTKKIKSHISGDKYTDIESVRDLVESRFSTFFSQEAIEYCSGELADVLDRLYDKDAAYAIDKAKKYHKAVISKLDAQSGNGNGKAEKEKQAYAVKKYSGLSTTSPNSQGLAEAVIINGKPVFACTINGGTSVTFFENLETPDKMLRPPTKQEYPPDSAYEYESEDEFMEHIRYALEQDSLYAIYKDTRIFYTKDHFVDTEPRNSTLLATYTITSYFQDKFSTIPYVWLVGDNGSGKNSILMTYSMLGYRVFYMAGASGANICEYLGTVEDAQGTLAEDENDAMDKDDYKRLLYMTGYAAGSCVPKILDGNTKGRDQVFYRSYCQKMSASENLPSVKYSKGVMDRTFVVKCVKGFPKYNIKATKKKTKTSEIIRLANELQTLRKRMCAYRLVHYDDVIQEIENISISGRGLELTESALQLFYQFKSTEEDNKIFEGQILPTLSSFLNDRLGRRSNSLEGKLYPIIRMMLDGQDSDEIDNDTIFNFACSEMDGRELSGKTDIFYVDDLGQAVTRKNILKVLREKFKAAPIQIIRPDGTRPRGHKISKEVMERIRASYEDQWEIKIGGTSSQQGNEVIEDMSAQQTHVTQVADQYGDKKENDNQPQKPQSHEEAKHDNEPRQQINGEENTPRITPGREFAEFAEQSYSIEDIIVSLLRDEQGNKTDCFNLDSWRTKLMLLPVQHPYHCNIDQADQTLRALIQEGKVRQIEDDSYEPTEEPR